MFCRFEKLKIIILETVKSDFKHVDIVDILKSIVEDVLLYN